MSKAYADTADGIIFTGRALISGVSVTASAVNTVTVDVYDGTDATGSKVFSTVIINAGSTDAVLTDFQSFPSPIQCDTGVYVDITGTGTYIIYLK